MSKNLFYIAEIYGLQSILDIYTEIYPLCPKNRLFLDIEQRFFSICPITLDNYSRWHGKTIKFGHRSNFFMYTSKGVK